MRWTLACALLIGVLPVSSESAVQPAPAAAYDVTSFAAELERLDSLLATADPADAVELRHGIPERWHIDTGDQRYEVSAVWLAYALSPESGTTGDWPTRRERIRSRLRIMRSEAIALAGTPRDRPIAEARRVLADVLQRREFQQQGSSAWRQAIEEKVQQWLDALGDRLGLSPGNGRMVAVTLAWIAGLTALGGLALLLTRMLTQRSRSVRLSIGAVAAAHVSARDWAMRFIGAVQRGDVREAVRCAYNACLRRFEEDGVWRVDPARTAREYLRLLPPDHNRRETLTEITRQFEQVWYGNQPLTADALQRVTGHLESLGCLPARESQAT